VKILHLPIKWYSISGNRRTTGSSPGEWGPHAAPSRRYIHWRTSSSLKAFKIGRGFSCLINLEPTETKVNFGRILRPQFEGLEASKWSQVYWDPKS